MRGLQVLIAAMLAAPLPVMAQTAPTLSERMAPFARLVGEWRGTGWFMLPQGGRTSVQSRELVTVRLSGNALLVEGRHSAANQPERIVHDALGMIVWDARQNAYRIRTQLATGQGGEFAIEPRPNGFVWGMDTPGGRIEYVAEIDERTWVERGARIMPDGRRIDFMEMRLTRQ
jgi:hypothetical protein